MSRENEPEEIRALRQTISAARDNIHDYEAAEERKANAGLVGKHFRYRNCYSCPETDADYWWLYIKVTHLDESGHPYGVSFQTDKCGKVEVEKRTCYLSGGNYQPISAAEFNRARSAMLRRVAALVSK